MREKREANNGEERFVRRKGAKQQRSRATVDSMKQAALEIIEKEGFASLSSAKIAERAGVGIGSFYDYFPNKEAVLLTLFESASLRLVEDMRGVLGKILDMPEDVSLELGIKKLLALHEQHKLILIDLVREMPEMKLDHHPLSFDNLGRGSILIYLEHRGRRMKAEELECRAFFIQHVITGCIRQYLDNPTTQISRRNFIAHLARILVPYMQEIAANDRPTSKVRAKRKPANA